MYIRTHAGLGQPQPGCSAAAHDLERLSGSLKMFKKESAKTYPSPKRLKLLGLLVKDNAQTIVDRLADYTDSGCCEPELKALEAEVRALSWTFQRTRGTKVVRVEVYRDIVRAHANLIKAIQQAQRTASTHGVCSGASGAQP